MVSVTGMIGLFSFPPFTQMRSQRRGSSWKSDWVSQRATRWWSNETSRPYITISSLSQFLSFAFYLSQTLFLRPLLLHLSRSPPRPSPGSLHYSDEDVSTKYNDLIPAESSSLTEKPSEISDSQVSSDPGLQPMPTPCLEWAMKLN